MLQLLEKFVLGIFATLVTYAITGQLHWSGRKRLGVLIGVGILALLAAVFADRLQSNTSVKGGPSTAEVPRTESLPTEAPSTTTASASPIARVSVPVNSQRAAGGTSNPEEEFVSRYVAPDQESSHGGGW